MPLSRRTPPTSTLATAAQWLPAVAWAYLALGRGMYWSAATRLPVEPPEQLSHWPRVVVVVPARDEAELLPKTLPSLLGQDYPGHAWVVLVDDQSSDATAATARVLAKEAHGRALGLKVVSGKPKPAGWAGKTWAMAQGMEDALAGPELPEWFLFTDADIRHPPDCIRRLVASAVASERDSVSLMARLSTTTAWERLLMPAFVYFFAQIYPFSWVNDDRHRTAAAAGGCLLVRAEALARSGGLEAVAAEPIDDVALAKALKSAGSRIWLTLAGRPGQAASRDATAPAVESLRQYPQLRDIWEMVARNAYTQLGKDPLSLAAAMAAMGSVYLAPPFLTWSGLAKRRSARAAAGLAAWNCMAATYLPIAKYYRVSPAAAAALPFTALLYMAMTVSSALRERHGGFAWKGRH
jgi:hopene-associated glycosyltransferase HpnB